MRAIGSTAVVRRDLRVGNKYGANNVVRDMMDYAGKTVTIASKRKDNGYAVEECIYDFTEEMFVQDSETAPQSQEITDKLKWTKQ